LIGEDAFYDVIKPFLPENMVKEVETFSKRGDNGIQ
jgi:hypothetical protein